MARKSVGISAFSFCQRWRADKTVFDMLPDMRRFCYLCRGCNPGIYLLFVNGIPIDEGDRSPSRGGNVPAGQHASSLSFMVRLTFWQSSLCLSLQGKQMEKNKGKPVNPLNYRGYPICPYYAFGHINAKRAAAGTAALFCVTFRTRSDGPCARPTHRTRSAPGSSRASTPGPAPPSGWRR